MKMSLHIADFCTSRENVHPYCIPCTATLAALCKHDGKWPETIRGKKVFVDTTAQKTSEDGISIVDGNGTQEVVILCDDTDAYGICLN